MGGTRVGKNALGDEQAAGKNAGREEGSVCGEEVVSGSLKADHPILSSKIFLQPGI